MTEGAEAIKIEIGSAFPLAEESRADARGRDLASGLPTTVQVGSAQIREAIQGPMRAILAAIRRALELTPPELAADLIDCGIVLTGGSARLQGLPRRIEAEIGLPVVADPDPLTCVIRGAGMVLDDWAAYRDVLDG